jgi:transposase-like protein
LPAGLDLSRFDAAPLIAFTATKETNYGTETDEFREDAVRIALTSGLTRKQVADDLGVGMSTLNKWITAHRYTDVVSKEDLGLAQENDRLRLENRILKEELKEIGLDVGHRRAGRLTRQNAISVVRMRKHKATTDSHHKFNVAPNLLDRNFSADKPNQKWAGDISYVWTREGWLYLAVIH